VISRCDAAVIATAHSAVNYRELVSWAPCIVDTRNALAGLPAQPDQVWKA
jgi:UDP-N-acetyl-D-glucosamine dehydrogenase